MDWLTGGEPMLGGLATEVILLTISCYTMILQVGRERTISQITKKRSEHRPNPSRIHKENAMKKLVVIMLTVLLASALMSCAKASSNAVGVMLKPGDKVGDFLITTGTPSDTTYQWNLDCTGPDEANTCKAWVGQKVNVSEAVYASTAKELDTLWSSLTDHMTINGTPVDLKAFGSVDTYLPNRGNMRLWNVVIVASKAGQLSVNSSGVLNGESFNFKGTFVILNR